MNDMKEIERIIVEDIGGVFDSEGKIEEFTVNGEMALVRWFRQGQREFNGKYVIEIRYKNL